MRRFVILVSVAVLAAASANCGGGSERNVLSPSSLSDSEAVSANGKGGGKPGGGGTTTGGGSLSLKTPLVDDKNSDGLPSFRDTVTFNVQTSATVYPFVTLICKQNGTVVSKESNGMFPTSLGQGFTLGPTALWVGGAADCTATLENWDSYSKNGSITALASMSFTTN